RAHAKDGQIVEDGIGSEEAKVTADLDGAEGRGTDSAVDLTEVDARGAEAEGSTGGIGAQEAPVHVVATDIDAEIGADVDAHLSGVDADLDRARQQPPTDCVGVLLCGSRQPAGDHRWVRILVRELLDAEEADVALHADVDGADADADAIG